MAKTIFLWCILILMQKNVVFPKKIEEISTCTNDTDCNEISGFDVEPENTTKEEMVTTLTSSTMYNTTEEVSIAPPMNSTPLLTTALPIEIISNNKQRNHSLHKVESEICDCDLTINSCDINCCCDNDCKEFHFASFSECGGDRHAELYDSRYCYSRNFIDRNNTPFILEKLASNLFCILYDNLPPTYTVSDDLDLKNATDIKNVIEQYAPTWNWESRVHRHEYNISKFYQHGDTIWNIRNNYIEPIELPQAGFTSLCTFKKVLKYLDDWKDSCFQTILNETNIYLFPNTFYNFSVVSLPALLNDTYQKLPFQDCPRNVCLPVSGHFCRKTWDICNSTMMPAYCAEGKCFNIVTGVKFHILHNGSLGMKEINAYFRIDNVSSPFHQHFEVKYEWVDLNPNKTFPLSGNPGYMIAKPIIIGTLMVNKTDNIETRYIYFNRSNTYLTLPIAEKSGLCNKVERYIPSFGENIKLRCGVALETSNFSSQSCIALQNRTMQLLLGESLFNITKVEQYPVYISKTGNITKNDTANWVQVLLDRVPQNVVTGQIMNGRLHCSGLVTSLHLYILYSTLPKPETLSNFKIQGAGISFAKEIDISWRKCIKKDCMNSLQVDAISYVTFIDVSKPSKYYFVGAPNLDLLLPHDFFYPFLSGSANIKLLSPLVMSIIICTFLQSFTQYI